MRFITSVILLIGFLPSVNSQVIFTGNYSQNFDTLANSGTSSVMPTGWVFSEAGANANTLYTAGTGSSNAGDTYSFGSAGSNERALGGLQSGSLISTIGASFLNSTGDTILQLDITYTGEQWRLGATARVDRLDFQYSLDANSLTTGTWTDFDSLDFTAPITAGAIGLLDGNLAANRTTMTASITGLSIANNSTFWIRWNDFNATGADDGLGVDDFRIVSIPEPSTSVMCSLFGLCGLAIWTRKIFKGNSSEEEMKNMIRR